MSRVAIALIALVALSALAAASAAPFPLSALLRATRAAGRNETVAELGEDACSFNSFAGTCKDIDTCDGTSIAGRCPGPNNVQCCIEQKTDSAGCGKAAVERGMTWVNMHLLYCQSAYMQRDYDTDCSSICYRAHNPHWNAYRSDCSGFVSWAYGLPAPGRVTSQFAPFVTDISRVLDSPLDLAEGDIINSVPAEHVMIFTRWLNDDHTRAEFLEEPGCSASPPYARVTQSDVTVHDGKITVAVNGMTFAPVRFHSNDPVC